MQLDFEVLANKGPARGSIILDDYIPLVWKSERNSGSPLGVYVFRFEGNMLELQTQGPEFEVFSFKLLRFRDLHEPCNLEEVPCEDGRVLVVPPPERELDESADERERDYHFLYRDRRSLYQPFTVGFGDSFCEIRFSEDFPDRCVWHDTLKFCFMGSSLFSIRVEGLSEDVIAKIRSMAADPDFDEFFDLETKRTIKRPRKRRGE